MSKQKRTEAKELGIQDMKNELVGSGTIDQTKGTQLVNYTKKAYGIGPLETIKDLISFIFSGSNHLIKLPRETTIIASNVKVDLTHADEYTVPTNPNLKKAFDKLSGVQES